MYDQKEYVVHIIALKQELNHRLVFKKLHRVIQFNQVAWLKPYIEKNTKFRTKVKNDFKKDFFKLMNNPVFRKDRDTKLVTTDKRRRNQLVSVPNYHTKNAFQMIYWS